MTGRPIKPFEELAREWAPRARRFLTVLANQVMTRLKRRLPAMIAGSTYILGAILCAAGLGAWLSAAGWFALRDRGMTATGASFVVTGVFLALALLFLAAARIRARRAPRAPPIEVLEPENREIEEAGQALITLFKDLTIAAKRSLSPNEVLKPHAVKVTIASTALGFLIALNLTSRKERMK